MRIAVSCIVAAILILGVLTPTVWARSREASNAAHNESTRAFCGTYVRQGIAAQRILEQRAADKKVQREFGGPVYVPVSIHIVRTSAGCGGIAVDQLCQSLDLVNSFFAAANMHFYVQGAVDYIDDDAFFFDIDTMAEVDALRATNVVPDTINLYVTANLWAGIEGISSFSWMPVQGIVMTHFGASTPILAHEMGHYFDLLHTHETALGAECVDGSNCDTAGDFICDTPADPNLLGQVDPVGCAYTGTDVDSCDSSPYVPDTTNVMSYTVPSCLQSITADQLAWAAETLVFYRPALVRLSIPLVDDCNQNGIWDLCETDCNENDVPDDCDVSAGTSNDCNGNGTPDECDIATGLSDDCNANGVPDECEVIQAMIDCALPGDEIVLPPGTYNEAIHFDGKPVTLRSVDPTDPSVVAATILDGTGLNNSIITCSSAVGNLTVISGLTFTNGDTTSGAGMFNVGASPTVSMCRFVDNTASSWGGAIYNLSNSNPIIKMCSFNSNAGKAGGAIFNDGSDPFILNCRFLGNQATAGSGGAIYNFQNSGPSITNCDFSGNTASNFGGAIACWASNPAVMCSTFSGNAAGSGNGGVLSTGGASAPIVTNCILWGNVPDEINDQPGSLTTASYCAIQDGFPGTGNLVDNPLFVDADGADNLAGTADDDLRLLMGSPCREAGEVGLVPPDTCDLDDDMDTAESTPIDLDGNARVLCALDMGAHEAASTTIANITQGTFHCSIQDAIDNATGGSLASGAGDVIVLHPGIYNESISLAGKAITLRSTDPDDSAIVAATVLDGTGLTTNIVSCFSAEGSDTIIEGLTITNGNAATGSAMYNAGTDPTVRKCVFRLNSTASAGAAIQNAFGASPTIAECVFESNTSSSWGGAIYNLVNSNPTLIDCSFIGNVGNGGGAMMSDASDPTVLDCRFHGNSSTGSGGAIYNFKESFPTFTNCSFSANVANSSGGGMVNWDSNPILTNCSFNDNTAAAGGSGSGGSVLNGTGGVGTGSHATLVNCILRGGSPTEVVTGGGSSVTVTYSNIEGGFAGVGNIDANPFFVDPDGPDDVLGTADDDLRIEHGSPCIDAGDNAAAGLTGVLTDLGGDDRFLDDPGVTDTGNGVAPIVDMGAYEFQESSLCAADTDGDGSIDIVDLLAVLAGWGPCPAPCPPTCAADVNNDCVVGIQDLLILLANWGPCIAP